MPKAKKYEMTYNSEHYTVAANDIIRGKQSMTLQTARLIRLLITQVVKEDKDLKTYSCKITDLAKAMKAEKLAFLTDIEGVYKDPQDPSTLISELTVSEAHKLVGDGYIGGGMLPKINNCIEAIESGVSRVHILDGRIPHCLLLEIFTNKGIGTAILNDSERRYYDGE